MSEGSEMQASRAGSSEADGARLVAAPTRDRHVLCEDMRGAQFQSSVYETACGGEWPAGETSGRQGEGVQQ